VYTLAVGSDDVGKDAYKEENERAAAAMAEAEKVAARSSTNLNPTEEDETANVQSLWDSFLCHRLHEFGEEFIAVVRRVYLKQW